MVCIKQKHNTQTNKQTQTTQHKTNNIYIYITNTKQNKRAAPARTTQEKHGSHEQTADILKQQKHEIRAAGPGTIYENK